MAIDYESIGRNLRQQRAEKKISQEELAKKANISVRHLHNIENGSKAPSIEILVSIANALDVSADDLLANV